MSVTGREDRKWTIWPTFVLPGSGEPACVIEGPIVKPGETVEVVPADQLAGAVDALREIKRVAAIEAPPVSDEVPAKVWKIAFDALNAIGGQ